jgi:hypothetical protein
MFSAGSGPSGSKYVLTFEIEGKQAKSFLKEMKDDLKSTTSEAGKGGTGDGGLAGISKHLEKGKEGASGLGSALGQTAMYANAALEIMEKVAGVGQTMIEVGAKGLGAYGHVIGTMMTQLSPLEGSMIRLQNVAKMTKSESMNALHIAQDLVQFTPFQENQVVGLVESLGIAKVSLDAFKDAQGEAITLNTAFQKGMSRVDETALKMAGSMNMTASTALADLAAMTGNVGQQMDFFISGMKRALQTGSLEMLTDQVPAAVLKAVFESTGGKMRITAQKAIDNLFKYLGQQGALGASVMASTTFEGVKSNFQDLPLIFARAIGGMPGEGGFYDKVKEGFISLFSEISQGVSSADFTTSLREAFAPVMEWMVKGLELLGKVVRVVLDFVKNHPGIVKFALVLGFVASAATVLAGVFLVGVVGAIMAFVAVLVVAAVAVTVFTAGIVLLATGILPLLLLGFGAIGLAAYAVYKAWDTNFGGIQTILSNIGTLVDAVGEAFENWGASTTEITEETAKDLQEAGLLDFFVTLMGWAKRAEVFFTELWHGLSTGADKALKHMEVPLHNLGVQLKYLWDSVKKVLVQFGVWSNVSETLVDDAGDVGFSWGDELGKVIEVIGLVLAWVIELGAGFVDWMGEMVDAVIPWVLTMRIMWNEFELMGDMFGLVIDQVVEGIQVPFKALYSALQHIVPGIKALLSGDIAGAYEHLKQVGNDAIGDLVGKQRGHMDSIKENMQDIRDAQAGYMGGRNARYRVGEGFAGEDARYARPTYSATPSPFHLAGVSGVGGINEFEQLMERNNREAQRRHIADDTPGKFGPQGLVGSGGPSVRQPIQLMLDKRMISETVVEVLALEKSRAGK